MRPEIHSALLGSTKVSRIEPANFLQSAYSAPNNLRSGLSRTLGQVSLCVDILMRRCPTVQYLHSLSPG